MPHIEDNFGSIDISPTAVTTIASRAVNQCYGVVGMSNKNLVNGIANLLSRDAHPGIDVVIEDGEITIDVYVILEYGIRIRTVAESVQHTVQFHVEKALGLPVRAVNVYIQVLRLEKDKDKEKAKAKSQKKES